MRIAQSVQEGGFSSIVKSRDEDAYASRTRDCTED